jgi:putative spermidine/putrescine transport system substrate-binding protein
MQTNGLRRTNRIQLLCGLLIAGGMGVQPIKANAEDTLALSSAGGAYDKCVKQAYLDDLESQSGVKSRFGSVYYDMGVWKTQQESKSYEWDVSIADYNQADQLVENGWITPIDPKVTTGHELVNFPGVMIKRGDTIYGIPAEIFGNVIVYNTDKFGANPPKTWADVFDLAKYPGKRLFSKDPADFGVLEMALLADGVAPTSLYPLDIDRALRKLDTIKSQILWYESGAQQITLLQQGDAVIGAGWDGRVKVLQKSGAKVDFTTNQALVHSDLWVIPKGGNRQLAEKYLMFILQPKQQAKFAECIGYSPAWKDAFQYLPKDEKFTVNADTISQLVIWNGGYWRTNAKSVTDKFNEWLTR